MAVVLTRAQIRGARAMLDLSLIDLASAARVSVSTVKRVQDGGGPLTAESGLSPIRHALEAGGIRFLPDEGHGAGIRLQVRPRR